MCVCVDGAVHVMCMCVWGVYMYISIHVLTEWYRSEVNVSIIASIARVIISIVLAFPLISISVLT